MAEYLEYTTQQDDRWDLIAYRFYGDATRYEPIVRANPHVAIRPTLPAGETLRVPVLEASDAVPSAELPPWKR